MDKTFSADDLAQRRASARRLGWWLGAGALALYLIGLLFQR